MKTGAVIVAAGAACGGDNFIPLKKLGTISMIERIIMTFQQAEADYIVVVTGSEAEALERHIARYNCICLRNTEYRTTQMLDSVKIGLRYLEPVCDQILLTPADTPLFTVRTVNILKEAGLPAAIPLCGGQEGHPILLSSEAVRHVLSYEAEGGIRGALDAWQDGITYLEVSDPGTLFDADTPDDCAELLEHHNRQLLRPQLKVCLAREETFFDARAAMLLKLLKQCHSVRLACSRLNISYSKGWKILNLLESQLGFSVIDRHPGGLNGGYTSLSDRGEDFLKRYEELVCRSRDAVEKIYGEVFGEMWESADSLEKPCVATPSNK